MTAHVLRALFAWRSACPPRRFEQAWRGGLAYLLRTQVEDGSWRPLWFGSQLTADGANPVGGTARVLRIYGDARAAAARLSAPDDSAVGPARRQQDPQPLAPRRDGDRPQPVDLDGAELALPLELAGLDRDAQLGLI